LNKSPNAPTFISSTTPPPPAKSTRKKKCKRDLVSSPARIIADFRHRVPVSCIHNLHLMRIYARNSTPRVCVVCFRGLSLLKSDTRGQKAANYLFARFKRETRIHSSRFKIKEKKAIIFDVVCFCIRIAHGRRGPLKFLSRDEIYQTLNGSSRAIIFAALYLHC
jgi:hypothetical protein